MQIQIRLSRSYLLLTVAGLSRRYRANVKTRSAQLVPTFSAHCEWRIGRHSLGKNRHRRTLVNWRSRPANAARSAHPGWLIERVAARPMALYGAPGEPLGRRGQIGWLTATVVDAAVFHAVVRISAQAIGLGFPRGGNIESGPVE